MKPIEIFKALSNETRLQMLEWLREPEKHFSPQEVGDFRDIGVCGSQFQEKLGITQSTVSQYLSILQKAGLVSATRIGKWTYFKRNEETIRQIAEFMQKDL
jgi:DNA-binding transcriptional ArsR family regulator